MAQKPKDRRYVLLKDIVIPAGTILHPAPILTQRAIGHFEALVSMSPDNAASFVIDLDSGFNEGLEGLFAPAVG